LDDGVPQATGQRQESGMRDRRDVQCSDQQGPAVDETVFSVPAMTCRHCVRAISAQVRDVAGVVAVEADMTSRTLRVQGTAQPEALRSAIAEAGHEAFEVNRSRRGQESTGGHLS
jgi:copper chaperone